MTKEEAREICLETILHDLGYYPVKKDFKESWYFLREEDKKSPSFKVNLKLNRWYDFGIGQGGNAIDLVMFIKNCDFISAIDYLTKFEDNIENIDIKVVKQRREDYKSGEKNYEILEVKKIFMYPLKNYLYERNIDLEVAYKFLKEIHYEMKGRKQYALCMENNSGGYAVRNLLFKGNLGNQDITTIDNGKEEAIVFEGFFNFLSYITLSKHKINNYNFEILNSANNIHKLEGKRYKKIYCFGDNDKTGKSVLEELKNIFLESEVIDKSNLYKNFKDLNEWHINQKNERNELTIKRSL